MDMNKGVGVAEGMGNTGWKGTLGEGGPRDNIGTTIIAQTIQYNFKKEQTRAMCKNINIIM